MKKAWRLILVSEGQRGGVAVAEVVGFDLYGQALDQARREARSGGYARVQLVDVRGRLVWCDDIELRGLGYGDRAGLGDDDEGFYTWDCDAGWLPWRAPSSGAWGSAPG